MSDTTAPDPRPAALTDAAAGISAMVCTCRRATSRTNADRWDFLTRFRADGVVAEYVGQRQIRGKSVETIRIIDTKYGRQRLAYFDTRNSLLSSETEAGTTTHYVEHRWTGDVFTSFEIAVARPCFGCIARYRWHTELNLDLTPDMFSMPPPMT